MIFGAFSLLSSLPFPEALLGQLLPCCCLQRSPSPPCPELLGILEQLVKHLLQAEQISQQPLQQPCAAKGTECINSPFWFNPSLNVTLCYRQCVTSDPAAPLSASSLLHLAPEFF